MSGVDYQTGQVTKQELQRLERFVGGQGSSAAVYSLGTIQNAVETVPKDLCSGTQLLLTQQAQYAYFISPRDQIVNNISILLTGADSGNPSLRRVGIYQPATQDSLTLNLLGASAASGLAIGATGLFTAALTSPVALSAGVQYVVAVLQVGGTTLPTLAGYTGSAALSAVVPRKGYLLTGQTDLNASVTLVTASAFSVFARLS